MTKQRWIGLLLVALTCWLLPFNAAWAERLRVIDVNGKTRVLETNRYDGVIGFASWCPYCKKFLAMLKDPAVQPSLKRKQIVFLFGGERKDVQSMPPTLMYPEVATQLDRPYYFYLPKQVKQDGHAAFNGFPSVYNPQTRTFDQSAPEWLQQKLKLSDTLMESLYQKYYKR
jgi:thiol-disulfide isomerase/thioredoxin